MASPYLTIDLDKIEEKYREKRLTAVKAAASASGEEAFLLIDLQD